MLTADAADEGPRSTRRPTPKEHADRVEHEFDANFKSQTFSRAQVVTLLRGDVFDSVRQNEEHVRAWLHSQLEART